jgi:hypothetical protein
MQICANNFFANPINWMEMGMCRIVRKFEAFLSIDECTTILPLLIFACEEDCHILEGYIFFGANLLFVEVQIQPNFYLQNRPNFIGRNTKIEWAEASL